MVRGRLATRTLARVVLFSALSGVGAFIPIPSPVGSIALDSAPGYFAALAFGLPDGALICAIGHILSATRAGYPLGAIHIPVAFLMATVGAATAVVGKKAGMTPGLIAGVTINTVGALLAVPIFGWSILLILVPLLLVASIVNATLAGIIFKAAKKRGVF